MTLPLSRADRIYQSMPPDLLQEIGESLFGQRWQSDLARSLDVSDRTVRRWLAGEFSIPQAVDAELRGILKERIAAISRVHHKLRAA